MAKKRKAQGEVAAVGAAIRSRIVASEDVDPGTLLANPLNFRTHPEAQVGALRGSVAQLGWVKRVVVNRATGHIIDGHARVEEAKLQGATVPVDWVELSEEEERLALAVLDPITELAERNEEVLQELLDSVAPVEDGALRSLLEDMRPKESTDAGNDGSGSSSEQNFTVTYNLVFENLAEQEVWFRFLAHLKTLSPEVPTISGRVVRFLSERVLEPN